MKRPMLMVAVIYLGGIVSGNFIESHGGEVPLWTPLLAVAVLALGALAWAQARLLLIAGALVAAGIANFSLHTRILSPHDLRRIAPAEPALASIQGVLLETPVHRVYSHQDDVTHRSQAELRVDAIRRQGGEWRPASGTVAVSTSGRSGPPYYQGRRVEVEGVLRAPPGPAAPGAFDYAAYLRRRGIHFQLQCSGTNDWRMLDDPAIAAKVPLADRFGAWAMATLARGLPAEDEPLRLLWAMTLGWRTALTGEVSEPFMRSGTMHVFAISGLHIALIAGLLVTLLRVCRLPRRGCALIVIPLLWLYTGATGWQASAVRSTIMMSVIVAGWLITRPSDLLNSLAASAFLILLWDPQQLFQAGFQLSFAVVLSLAMLGPFLDGLRERLFHYEPWVPDELRPRWQHWLRRPLDYIATSFTVSLAAWLGSLPVVAAYFNLLTPVSLLANLIVVPLSSGALACGLGSLVIGPFVPFCGELFNHSAWFFMALMIRASEWAAAIPAGCVNVPTPGPLPVLLYYATLVGALAGVFGRPTLRLRYGAVLLILAAAWLAGHLHERAQTRLTVLPMNGGSAIHLEHPRAGEDWLIDCGDESSAAFVLKPYLRRQGINRLDNLLITHGDVHHAGGAPAIRDGFRPRRAWLSAVPFRSTVYRATQRDLSETPGLTQTLHRGQHIAPWTVLHPDDGDRLPQADDNAVVLLGRFHNTRVVLLSDLGKPGQNLLMSRHPDLRADIAIAGIPAQSEPLADALIEMLQPRLLIVADAEYPASRRASPRLRERLEARAIPVLYTRETGALTITFKEDSWRIDTTRPGDDR